MKHLSKRCKNCNSVVHGKYCSNCGQKTNLTRINLHHVLHAFLHGLIHFDTGFLFTAKELVVRPGATIREFILGKRVNHGNPLFMFLIVGGLLSYVYYRLAIKTMGSVSLEEIDHQMHLLTSKFFAVTFLGYALVFAFIDLLFFKYKHYNYVELFYLNVFIAIAIMMLNLFMAPILYTLKGTGINVYLRLIVYVASLIYLFVVHYQFYELAKDKKGIKLLWMEMLFFVIIITASGIRTFQSLFL